MTPRCATVVALFIAAALFVWPGSARAAQSPFKLTTIEHQEKSLYRNIIVASGDGMRCLTFGRAHAKQTCIALADRDRLALLYTQGLMASLYVNPSPRRVLIIGLGGGVLPRAFRALYPHLEIDAVELDPAVVTVAKDYFGYVEDTHSRAHVIDGRVFVRQQGRAGVTYDIVVIDAFEAYFAPEHLTTVEFLRQVKAILAPSGIVAANTFAHGTLRQHETATYAAVFGGLYSLELTSGNRILFAGTDPLPSLEAIRANATRLDLALSALSVRADDLLPLLAIDAPEPGVRLLTDQFSPVNLLLHGQ